MICIETAQTPRLPRYGKHKKLTYTISGSGKVKIDRIIGYSPAKNIVIPIFEELSMEDFKMRYSGSIAVVASQLAQDEDFTPDIDEEVEN